MISIPSKLWLAGVAALIVAAALAYHFVKVSGLEAENKRLSESVATLKARNELLSVENQKCAESVQNQNQAITDLMRLADERREAARKAVASAEQKAAQHAAEASRLASRPMPKPDDACASLDILLNEAIGGRK